MYKQFVFIIISFFVFSSNIFSQHPYSDKLVNTYSIVARDPETGEMGVAVQSNWFSVGSVVSWAEAGVGAVATQSFTNISFGPRGLELLKRGKTAGESLDILINSDEGRDVRQLAIVDSKGNVSAFTGENCIPAAGHQLGDNFSVQANLMLNENVWPAMAKAFKAAKGPLAERMMAALEAAQAAGGDIRGKQSAAILVVKGTTTGITWEDRIIDLRIEDHSEPVKELKRVLKVHRAYEFMNQGDVALEHNKINEALKLYSSAEAMFPENMEMKFWHAVCLANVDRVNESLPMFKIIFSNNRNWKILIKRLPKTGLLNIKDEDLTKILKQ